MSNPTISTLNFHSPEGNFSIVCLFVLSVQTARGSRKIKVLLFSVFNLVSWQTEHKWKQFCIPGSHLRVLQKHPTAHVQKLLFGRQGIFYLNYLLPVSGYLLNILCLLCSQLTDGSKSSEPDTWDHRKLQQKHLQLSNNQLREYFLVLNRTAPAYSDPKPSNFILTPEETQMELSSVLLKCYVSLKKRK